MQIVSTGVLSQSEAGTNRANLTFPNFVTLSNGDVLANWRTGLTKDDADVMLSCEEILIECALDGTPVNFSYSKKTNSQDLRPIQRISWSITGWRRSTYLSAVEAGKCATYAGKVDFFPINSMASHIIKTEEDLRIAEALWPLMQPHG